MAKSIPISQFSIKIDLVMRTLKWNPEALEEKASRLEARMQTDTSTPARVPTVF